MVRLKIEEKISNEEKEGFEILKNLIAKKGSSDRYVVEEICKDVFPNFTIGTGHSHIWIHRKPSDTMRERTAIITDVD